MVKAYCMAWVDYGTKQVTKVEIFSEPNPTQDYAEGYWTQVFWSERQDFHMAYHTAEAVLNLPAFAFFKEIYNATAH